VGPSYFPAFWKFESDITHGATFLYILWAKIIFLQKHRTPVLQTGSNLTIVSHNDSALKNATSSLVRFENNISLYFVQTL
jgi:hypothetical protein